MNVALKRTVLAIAVGMFCSTGAYATGMGQSANEGDDPGTTPAADFSQSYSLDQSATHKQKVVFDKKVKLSTDVAISGQPTISGSMPIDSAAISLVDNRQKLHDNNSSSTLLDNEAAIGDDVARDASGNIQMNVAAGDTNQQDNAAALAATDASFVFGMADGEVFVNQLGHDNTVTNAGVVNNAGIGGNAFSGAAGNLGANVASGTFNQQKNALAASVATSRYAQATVDSSQYSKDNSTSSAGYFDQVVSTVGVSLSGDVSGSYEGDTRGNAYQANNYYPEMWNGNGHRAGSQTGHIDYDGESQGAVLNPYRTSQTGPAGEPIGGFAFDTDSHEIGDIDLGATLTGQVTYTQAMAVFATNTAGLSGSAFRSASGNIGVNVASGIGNQQANSLALAVAQPSTGAGGGGE